MTAAEKLCNSEKDTHTQVNNYSQNRSHLFFVDSLCMCKLQKSKARAIISITSHVIFVDYAPKIEGACYLYFIISKRLDECRDFGQIHTQTTHVDCHNTAYI